MLKRPLRRYDLPGRRHIFRFMHTISFYLSHLFSSCHALDYNAHVLRRTIIAILFLAWATGCSATNAATAKVKPVVDVIAPPDGARFAPGERISLRVAAASSGQIARIELHVNGALVAAQDNPSPSATYTALLQFVPSQTGPVTLIVNAIDTSGQSSDPVNLTVMVGSVSILDTASTATPATPNGTSPAPDVAGCKLSATFVADVTIPDNTAVNGGASLIKTWRIRNSSLCAWENGYQLAYTEGDQMGAPASVPVPPTARDAAVDISVPFTAPVASGTYTSTWRMRSPDGTAFGNRVFVVIRVNG